MTEAQLYIIFSIAAIIPLLQIALSRFMQPLRIEFANLGFDLLQDPTINDRQRNLINKLLDDAYNWKAAIFLAIFALPVAVYIVISKAIGADKIFNKSPFRELESHPKGKKFIDLAMFCMLGSNPLASLITMIQLIPVMLALSIILRSFEKSKSAIESQFFGYVATAKRI